jgi:rod shape-determining protein MreC
MGYSPYRKKRSYTLAIIILLLALFFSLTAYRDLFGLRSVILSAVYPFQFAAVSVWKGITNVPASVFNLRNLAKQNAELKNELDNLKPKLVSLEELIKENKRLKNALSFKQNNGYRLKLLPAQVIGKSPAPWFSILQINKGSRAGVKANKAVITKDGLAGRIIEVSAFSSKVMMISAGESSVAAMDARSRDYGVVSGSLSNEMLMKYVSAAGDIKEGDKIVTSLIATVIPPGLPIGTVAHASKVEHDLFYRIKIKSAVDFSKIEEVFIVL